SRIAPPLETHLALEAGSKCGTRAGRIQTLIPRRLHDAHAAGWIIPFSQALQNIDDRILRIAQVEHDDLVGPRVDQIGQLGAEAGPFPRVEIAEEDAELHVVAAAGERVEHAVAALVVADVVGDQVVSSSHQRVTRLSYWAISPRSQRASRRAWTRMIARHEQR